MRVLLLDIECAPTIAGIWRLYDDYVGTDQILQNGYVLCFSAKWLGEKDVFFGSVWGCGQEAMLKRIHELLDEADVVVHYNGIKFDIPTLNREFVEADMPPPSPAKHIDLLPVVRSQFKFVSNKLDFVCQRLGLGAKVKHKGMELWVGCMNGDAESHETMEKYNKRDVILLEKLYNKLIPWVAKHPNVTLYTGKSTACPRCGSSKFQSRGIWHGVALSYRRFQCQDCGGWFRGERVAGSTVEHRPV